ncbi:hypothetical protein BO71DRAFT_286367, partial [Aspergillus ellipticus CBS 707.79]
IWHNDLHTDNIFVDENNPTQITAIIDWQSVPVYPMFLTAHPPSLVEYDGPKPERFVQPRLPANMKEMNTRDKQATKEPFLAQTLWIYYETQVNKEAPDLPRAFKYRETVQWEICSLIGSIFDDGEPYVQKLLTELAREEVWEKLVGEDDHGRSRVSCPLEYTQDDLEKYHEEYVKWERDVERKARVFEEVGVYTGWNGAVSPGDY